MLNLVSIVSESIPCWVDAASSVAFLSANNAFYGLEQLTASVNGAFVFDSGWLSFLGQVDVVEPVADALAVEGEAPAPNLIQQLLGNPLLPIVGFIAIFYVTFLGPERRKKADEAKLMSSLSKNDRVVTIGGVHGTIVSASPDSDIVTVKIDENSNTRIKVNRSAIASVVNSAGKTKTSDKPGKELTKG